MSTIFKTRISQQEVQTPTLSATAVVTDNFITSSIQSESVASENINATTVQGEEIIANDLSTENIAISNDLSIGQDVIVPSGNVLVGRRGIVSFVDDGEEVDENGASGFPIYNGVPEVLNNSTVYNIGEIDKDIDLSNIRFGGNDNMVQTCEIWFSIPADTYEITWPENVVWLDSTDGNAPAIVKGTEYRIVLRKENEQIVASIAYAIGEGSEIVSGNMMEGVARLDADNTFSAGNTFTGAVDMSGASVTPPSGWNVADLTPEAIQQVVPMVWREDGAVFIGDGATTTRTEKPSVAIGKDAKCGLFGVSVGVNANSKGDHSVMIGYGANSQHMLDVCIGFFSGAEGSHAVAVGSSTIAGAQFSTAIGSGSKAKAKTSLTFGSEFAETTDSGNVTHFCTTEGTGSITIGAGANTLNNGDTESSNSVTIGCKAENKGADSVVLGAQAKGTQAGSVVIGAGAVDTTNGKSIAIGKGAKSTGYQGSTTIGFESSSGYYGTSVGYRASTGNASTALGSQAKATNGAVSVGVGASAQGLCSMAFGYNNILADNGTISFLTSDDFNQPTAKTKLYIVGANTPLANEYYNGEAFMGYVVTDSAGTKLACGTRRLSELFPDNSLTQPASLDENGEWVMPKVFHPSDLDMPQEEPTESEEYQPLPVYPIVEPEIEEI